MKHQETIRNIGQNIAGFRKAAGLTQEQLGRKIGISQSVLASYEIGRRSTPVELLAPLATVLEISVDQLVGGTIPDRKKPGPASQMDRKLEKIKSLPRTDQQFVSRFLDQVLANAQHN